MGLFEVGFLALSHLLACIVSFILRIIIKNYLKKKPPGLQSVLDLLIIDLVRVQMFNYAFFMCSLFIGIFHGQLPFFPAQLIIFILQNSDVYVLGLFQCFLVIKAVLIFRGSWMAEVTDSWILRLYRTSAVIYTAFRFIGDGSTQDQKPGVLTKFLTGTDVAGLFPTGPFHLSATVILLLSSIILHLKLPLLQEEDCCRTQYKVMKRTFWFVVPILICSILIPFLVAFGQLEFFLFAALVHSVITQMYPMYFIMNHPKLKQYFLTTLRDWSKHKFIFYLTPNFTTWKNVFLIVLYNLTLGLVFEYKWPKAPNNNNKIVPV